jgi:hypothetical protein
MFASLSTAKPVRDRRDAAGGERLEQRQAAAAPHERGPAAASNGVAAPS